MQRLQIRRAPTDRQHAHFRPSATRRRLPPGTTPPAGFPASLRSRKPLQWEACKRRKRRAAPGGEGHIFLRCGTRSTRRVTQNPKWPDGWPTPRYQRPKKTSPLQSKTAEAREVSRWLDTWRNTRRRKSEDEPEVDQPRDPA